MGFFRPISRTQMPGTVPLIYQPGFFPKQIVTCTYGHAVRFKYHPQTEASKFAMNLICSPKSCQLIFSHFIKKGLTRYSSY